MRRSSSEPAGLSDSRSDEGGVYWGGWAWYPFSCSLDL